MFETPTIPLSDLIVCPHCDAAYTLRRPGAGEKATCARCGADLITPRRKAGLQIIAVSMAIAILIVAASVFPFLTIEAAGTTNSMSLLDTIFAFNHGLLIALSLAMASLILIIPLTRALLGIYVLFPIVVDRAPAPGATHAYRLSEALRPWSMAEIFVIGCAVALVKISGIAHVTFGPAFWMFATLVILTVVQDNFICRWSVWNSLDKTSTS